MLTRIVSFIVFLAAVVALLPADRVVADGAVQVVKYSESFDSVPAPAFPAGWQTSSTGSGAGFQTTTNLPDTAPNNVFSPSPATTSSAILTSPAILITGAESILKFKHKHALETTWDGAVLELSLNGGPFQDIIDSGGTFLAGGYSHDLNPSTNPLGGRRAWSGATQNGYSSVAVRLPANSFGQSARFRWIIGTNDSFGVDGWTIDSVTIETNPTGANLNAISVPASGNANPYPSAIQIAGLTGFVTGVSVSLENVSHTNPDDLDVMLVAPNGRRVILMSDSGGSNAVTDIDLTISDSAATQFSDEGGLSSGLFKPTNFDSLDIFPPPAPQSGSAFATLGSLFGTNPNGTWELFVVDDNGAASGSIGEGWSIDIKTSVNACQFSLLPSVQAFGAGGGNGSFQISIPTGCSWTASTASSFLSIVSAPGGVSSGSIDFSVAPNTVGARTGTISVTDGITVRTFQAQQASGCPTSVSQTNVTVPAGGGVVNLNVSAGAGCSWTASSPVSWISTSPVPQSGNGIAPITVAANAARDSRTATVSVGAQSVNVTQAGLATARFDFDGDGRSDVSVFRNGTWHLSRSALGYTAVGFGLAADRLAPADYDGDGKSDIAVFRDGVWYVLRSSDNQVSTISFGLPTDIPVPADYDGNGVAEIAVFRSGIWFVRDPISGGSSQTQFGIGGDKPVASDYDGDGRTDFAVFRNGTWFVMRSSLGFISVQFGVATDRPVAADYNGDGRSDPAVFRNGQWHLLADFQTYSVNNFGIADDVPVPADYDGDGRADRAVFRNGVWYLDRSTQGVAVEQFGIAADVPVPAAFAQ